VTLVDLDVLRAQLRNQRSTWGSKVKARRTALGLTLAQVAEMSEGAVRAQTLSKIELGEIEPRDYMKLAIAVALLTEVDALFPMPSREEATRLLKVVAA